MSRAHQLAFIASMFGLFFFTHSASAQSAASKGSWLSGVTFNAQVEGGIDGDVSNGAQSIYGRLFDDKANQPTLNQALATVQRPAGSDWEDIGFKLQMLYGSDARYTHFLGELDRSISSRYQIDVVEADVQSHIAAIGQGGLDLKVGQYPSPLGYEVIDPSGNSFYSHSYLFNFGVPFKHTGVLTVTHLNPVVDVYLGVDSGANTSLGGGDNNASPGELFGFNLTSPGGKVTLLALTHMGPENPSISTPEAQRRNRYYSDVVLTYKPNDKFSFVTELNDVKDVGYNAEAYGFAQYASYAISSTTTLNARGEIWRDTKGFFIAQFPGNLDYVKLLAGLPNGAIAGAAATYGEITLGVTYKPHLPASYPVVTFRPEVRVDRVLTDAQPFDNGHSRLNVTLAADMIVAF